MFAQKLKVLEKEVADLEVKAREVAQQAYSEYIGKRVKDDEEALKKINIKMEKKQTQIQEAHQRKNKIEIIFNCRTFHFSYLYFWRSLFTLERYPLDEIYRYVFWIINDTYLFTFGNYSFKTITSKKRSLKRDVILSFFKHSKILSHLLTLLQASFFD